MEEIKNLIQTATLIHQALEKLKQQRYLELLNRLKDFVRELAELAAESRRMGKSLAHGWFLAADKCRSRIHRLLYDIPYTVSRIQHLADAPNRKIATMSALVEELKQLKQEFDRVEFDKDENTLSAVTEPISLEGLYLGPFKIQLHIERLGRLYTRDAYFVLALEPNPAANDESVTHPHVNNEVLCEGDGAAAIRAALEQGRISDFFTMVRSILNTYNPDSAHITIDEWDGEACYECGYTMNRDDCYYCSFCDHTLCEECSTYCRSCDESICFNCAARCEICEEPVCPRCTRTRCTECQGVCCESCIDDGLCPRCKQELENNNEQPEDRDKSQSKTDSKEVKLTG